MKIGITSSSSLDPRNIFILNQLIENNISIKCIIVCNESKLFNLKRRISFFKKKITAKKINPIIKYANDNNIIINHWSLKKICKKHGIIYINSKKINHSKVVKKINEIGGIDLLILLLPAAPKPPIGTCIVGLAVRYTAV